MQAVVFDLDDTLYPRERFVRSGLAAVAHYAEARFGISSALAFTRMLKASESRPGGELQALCLTFGLPPEVVPDFLRVFRSHRPELWLSEAACGGLRHLRCEGWRLAVLTNGLPPVQAAKVHALGLHALVDHVVYAAEYSEHGKPHRAPYDEVIRRLGVAPHRCVMVGDDEDCDVLGGRAAGMRTIRVRRPGADVSCGADAVVESLAQVPAAAASLIPMAGAHAA